ncbi:MAG: (d)CMP kinase [Bacteroidetes bacterium]|jgi:cytidylate kinase|nr:MAG: (d)CMP kinase [Bacteroidota bacterium]PTM20500.1 MAG: (d)CMP kinase [Bacteroidota bacterium]
MIIVIDGPAGSGKSSTAKALASRCNLTFLDSGAIYRAIALLWLQSDRPDDKQFTNILSAVDITTHAVDHQFRVFLRGEDVSNQIRTPIVAGCVSDIAKKPFVREFVNQYMRDLVQQGAFIADGRDLGTAVFPNADLKFYMDASVEERARRRYQELTQSGSEDVKPSFEDVLENVRQRDHTDSHREMDPLKKADDAILIDTTSLSFEEQIQIMADHIEKQKHQP